MVAEILCVGTELLMGQVLNTNAQFLSRRCSFHGSSHRNRSFGVTCNTLAMASISISVRTRLPFSMRLREPRQI